MTVTQKPNDSRLIALVELVQAVNERLNQFYYQWINHEQLEIANKSDDSPLTEADIAAHHMIGDGLSKIQPGYPVLSEESSDFDSRHDWQTFWLVDPLDGTREFVKKTGEFTVNIALVEHGQATIGVIGLPQSHKVYIGQKGGPVYCVEQQGQQSIWSELPLLSEQPLADAWNIAITRRSDRKTYEHFKELLAERKQAYNITNACLPSFASNQ
jgi:3'(2'), 5'-bisphosphate nucleotidase